MLYATKSGNTKKVADEIAKELNCESLEITNTTPPVNLVGYDVVFVGTGIHFGNPNEDIVRFLKTIDLKEPKLFAIFLTWGGAGKTDQEAIAKLKNALESKGQLIGGPYKCFGGRQFSLLKRGHPNIEDFKAAKVWAKKIFGDIH